MVRSVPNKGIHIPVHAEGWRFILPLLAVGVVGGVLGSAWAGGVFWFLAACVAVFFRDPERRVSQRPDQVLSPADGKVICVEEVELETEEGVVERLRRVGIFLSVFNTHIQRAPTYGRVMSVDHRPGKFLNALSEEASSQNEHNMIWMRSNLGTIGVKQIAGLIARRVVCKVAPGENLVPGQRLGLIRFGSQTDAYFPLDAEVRVATGQKVKAGLTVLAVAAVRENGGDDAARESVLENSAKG